MPIISKEFETTVILPSGFAQALEEARQTPTPYPGAMLVWVSPDGSLAGLEAYSAGGEGTSVPVRGWYVMQVYVGDKAVQAFIKHWPALETGNTYRIF